MFVGSFEISISAIVKDIGSIGIIMGFLSAWGRLVTFSMSGGQEKLLGCGLLERKGRERERGWCPGWHYVGSSNSKLLIGLTVLLSFSQRLTWAIPRKSGHEGLKKIFVIDLMSLYIITYVHL